MKKYQQVTNLLENLKLKGMIPNLDSEITEAEEKKISYLSFLDLLLKAEIDYRTERRLKRNLVGAHFPVEKEHLKQAIDLCLENRTYSIANLYDTYQYYQQEKELTLPKVKIVPNLRGIPREKKEFQVEKRDIGVYRALVNVSEARP